MERGRGAKMGLFRLLAKIYFHQIKVKGELPEEPSFYISNHRNGAVDGLIIFSIFKQKLKAVIGKNLTKSAFMRLFFKGQIEIYRYPKTMEEMRHNRRELNRIQTEIEEGTNILMFPEGTSHLGRGLLEIRKGVAHVVTTLKDRKVVPIGLHYEKGWSFRSNVMIHIGEPFTISGKNTGEIVNEIKKQMERVYDDDYQFPKPKRNVFLGICLTPIILLFYLANLIALLIPYFVAKKCADDVNVITLWRLLSGIPAFFLQLILYIILAFWNLWLILGYFIITPIGLFTYRAWKDAFHLD